MKPAELPVIAQSRLSSSPPPSYPSLPPAYSSPSPSESSIPLLAPSSGKRRKTAGLPKRALATTAIPNSRTPSLSSSCSRKSSSSSLWSLASFPDSPSPATPVSPLSTFSAVSPGATRFSEFADVETSWEKASRLGSKIPAGSMFSSFEPLPRTPPTNLLAGRTERFDFSFDSQISQVDPALAYPDLAAIDTSAPTQYAPMGVFDQTSSINSPFGDVTSFDGIVNFSFDGSFSHPSMLQSQSGSMDDLSGLLSSPGLDLSNSMFQASSSTFGLPPLGLDLNLDDIFTMDLQQQQTIPSFDSPSWQIHSSTADITGNVTVGSMPIPDVSSSVFYNPDCVNAGFISAF
ncbi:hypothetical protein DL96DRAFT_1574441 [Flagelloscypha sp. PMI_526]|nr:hypothetical protein DL96DRAFT_1574441 [Flagelloscypha sp. PMI_526]